MARGHFWSLIPIIQLPLNDKSDPEDLELSEKYREATNVSLERARGCYLDIAAVLNLSLSPDTRFDILGLHSCRIRTINIIAQDPSYIRHMMDVVTQGATPTGTLFELSLCQNRSAKFFRLNFLPKEYDYLYSRESSGLASFNQLLESVSVLRVRGVYLRWDTLVFSSRLTKLRLQNIHFGRDCEMATHLCHALASATELRELEIVSIVSAFDAFPDSETLTTPSPTISFPNLQSLLIDDVYANTLQALFALIASRSHRLTLHLRIVSHRLKMPYHRGGPRAQQHEIQEILEQMPVHELCIHSGFSRGQLVAKELRGLLESVPTVDTLFMDEKEFTKEACSILQRNNRGTRSRPSAVSFPSFQRLFFSRASIRDIAAFKRMVASHSQSMKQIILGGLIYTGEHGQPLDEANDRNKKFTSQLEEMVPDFSLIDSTYILPEFQQDWWQLW